MINGLQFDVRSNELQEQLNRQVEESTKLAQRSGAYAEELRNHTPTDASKRALTSAIETQSFAAARAESLRWLSKHVVPNDTYRVSLGELNQIGIVQGVSFESISQPQPWMFQRPVGETTRANA